MASVHKPSNLFPPGYQFAVPVLVLLPLGLPSDLGPYGGAVGVSGPTSKISSMAEWVILEGILRRGNFADVEGMIRTLRDGFQAKRLAGETALAKSRI